jgi:NAD(P)-dependent dehydrogenase (short-subunit alcohol dehydrogenase family)
MGMLEGKVALITGAGTGIGKGTARMFVDEGATVVIAARRESLLEESCRYAPERMSWARMDLTSADERQQAIDAVIERHGRLDVLVSNAGYQLWKTFDETSDEEIDELFYTNLSSTTRLIKQALPHLERSKGNIVIVSSTAGRYTTVPTQKLTVYSASKAGLNQLARTLAPELGPKGVRINVVAPGVTRGEYADASIESDPAVGQWILASTPMGRFGEAKDIAPCIVFLASDMAAWVTGQILDASGGWQIGGG